MNTNIKAGTALPAPTGGGDIGDWRPEDNAFWEATGKRIAYRNLWISVPALLCGFAVWGMWGIITVQMLNLGFPFTQAELFTLTAIAGISGATMRIPASFLIRLAGGRNTIFLTTAMLLAPALGTGIVLQHKAWPLWAFQLMALWCGVRGGHPHLDPERRLRLAAVAGAAVHPVLAGHEQPEDGLGGHRQSARRVRQD